MDRIAEARAIIWSAAARNSMSMESLTWIAKARNSSKSRPIIWPCSPRPEKQSKLSFTVILAACHSVVGRWMLRVARFMSVGLDGFEHRLWITTNRHHSGGPNRGLSVERRSSARTLPRTLVDFLYLCTGFPYGASVICSRDSG